MGEDASRFEEKIKQFKDNWSKDDPLWIWFRKVRGQEREGEESVVLGHERLSLVKNACH